MTDLNSITSAIVSKARTCQLSLFYENKNITKDISNYLESFSFTERAENGKSDDAQFVFNNTEHYWNNNWFPERGAKIYVEIQTDNWFAPGDSFKLNCGSFEIDEITDTGPPSSFSIAAISVGVTSSIRGQQNSKAWENFKFSHLVEEIAIKHKFGIFFDSNYDPIIDRFDQKNESDLSFLIKVAEYVGVNVRLANQKIIIFQEQLYDDKDPSLVLKINENGYLSHSFKASSADIYAACHVQYTDNLTGKMLTYQFYPNGRSGVLGSSVPQIESNTRMVMNNSNMPKIEAPKVGKVLKINRRCKSVAEAQQLAKSSLRNKNKRELTGSLSFMGNILLRAGLNLSVKGFGRWDSTKWSIEQAHHSWSKSSGLTTEVTLRGVLTY